MDVCCSGGQSIVTVLPSKKEVVPSFFSRLASTISMRIFCHRRAQEDRSDDIGGVVWGGKGSVWFGNSVEIERENGVDHVSPAAG